VSLSQDGHDFLSSSDAASEFHVIAFDSWTKLSEHVGAAFGLPHAYG
jgi:hypothetical protein